MKKHIIFVLLLCLFFTACGASAKSIQNTTESIASSSTTVPLESAGTQHGVTVSASDQSIVPVGGTLVRKLYDENLGGWVTAIYPPMRFENYSDEQIPTLELTAPVQLHLGADMELANIEAQTQKGGDGTDTTLQQLSELSPGTYYIRMVVLGRDSFVADDWETTTYVFGFKLVVPPIPPGASETTKTPSFICGTPFYTAPPTTSTS